ncbi:amino acid ABC transporter permease [Chloroflexota bacterium]
MATTNKQDNAGQSRALPFIDRLSDLPYWLLVAIFFGVVILWAILNDETYRTIFARVSAGVKVTVYVTLVAYSLSLMLGLLIGLACVSSNKIIYQASTFYVEIVRGVPMLVLLYYIAFVMAPGLVQTINGLGENMLAANFLPFIATPLVELAVRDLSFTARAILALTLGYAAFLSEVFRGGIESIEKGQMEAARSVGMTYWQAMRWVILPQAIRRVLPPLGNNFVAMLKDSSLVSVLGVRDITMLGKVYSTSTFRFFETYNVVAFLYLTMTIALSMAVRYMERRMSSDKQ